MTERRSSVGLRASTNTYSSNTNAPHYHARARSAERSVLEEEHAEDHDQVSDRESDASEEEEYQRQVTRNRLGSDQSANSSSHHYHHKPLSLRRSNSDPFENAGREESSRELTHDMHAKLEASKKNRRASLADEEDSALPTFNRFPFAEMKNSNCWSEPPHTVFMIRGPNYLNDKKKIQCQEFLLPARGCDLFLSDHPKTIDMAKLKGALGGNFRKKPTFLVRFIFPWGLLVVYFEVPEKLQPFLQRHDTTTNGDTPPLDASLTKCFSPPELALAKWFAGDTEYKNDRLKLIAYVPEGPWIVRNMVTGRPAIIGKKLPVSYQYTPRQASRSEFLTCDLDIGSSKPAAKRIVSVCRRYMSALSVDIGFVVEGTCKEDLPEEMFGGIRIHQPDPIRSPTI